MIPAEQEIKKRASVVEQVNKITSINYRDLYRAEELGKDLGFECGSAVFERTWTFLRQLTLERLGLVPYQALERIERFVQSVAQMVDRIRGFRVSGSGNNPVAERNQLVERLEVEYFDMLREMPSVAMLFMGDATRERVIEEKSNAALARILIIEEKATSEAANRAKQSEDLLDKMRQASGKIALQTYSDFFDKEATAASKLAVWWLIATVIASAAMTTYLIWLVFYWARAVPDYSPTQLIQAGGAKVALFTVGFYAMSWVGRNYKAQWHIRVVNNHRANTLNALEAFSNSAKNDHTREAILIHASSAIFAQVNTGFIPDQSDAPSTPSILEIVRGGKAD
jgi:hypothetical protein